MIYQWILVLLKEQPYLYLDEIRDAIFRAYGLQLAVSTVWKSLSRVKWNKNVVSIITFRNIDASCLNGIGLC